MLLTLLIYSGPDKFSPSVTRLRVPIPGARGHPLQPGASEPIYPGQGNETSQTDNSIGLYQTVGSELTHKPLLANQVLYRLSYPG